MLKSSLSGTSIQEVMQKGTMDIEVKKTVVSSFSSL